MGRNRLESCVCSDALTQMSRSFASKRLRGFQWGMKRSWLIALSFTFLAPASGFAESGRLNLHLDVGVGAPLGGAARVNGGDHSNDSAAGGIVYLGADVQLSDPDEQMLWAIDVMFGVGGFGRPFPTSTETGARYGTFAVGGRLRLLNDDEGYATEPQGTLPSHLWVSAHVGFHRFDDVQFGFDAAVGYMLSVHRPLQLGAFLRAALMFAGDNASTDFILVGGLSVTIEAMPSSTTTDTDRDGLSDQQEIELGTNPESPDTDRDGLNDGLEVRTETNPTEPDSDDDGLNDGREDRNHDGVLDDDETDPRRRDTDGGGMSDADEVREPSQDPRYRADDDRDNDGVINTFDQCPGTEPSGEDGPGVNAMGCPALADTIELTGVEFRSNRADIRPQSIEPLQRAADMLRRSSVRVQIAGFTDDRGSARRNQRLSERRAAAVRDWFVQHGLHAGRFEVHGYGEAQPVESNDTSEGRARNRRIELRPLR